MGKNILIGFLMLFILPISAMATESGVLRITNNDGKIAFKNIKAEKISENVSKLVVKAADIPADTKYLDVFADVAQARKGDGGFWLLNRGFMGDFGQNDGFYDTVSRQVIMPYYAMKTPKETFIAVIDGMRYECSIAIEAKNGHYEMYPRWYISDIGFLPYEDIEITYYKLPADADYNAMAKTYRKHKFSRNKQIKPLKERFAEQKNLSKQCDSIALRMRFGQKPFDGEKDKKDFTPENQYPVGGRSFADGLKLLYKIKEAGVDEAYVCTEGWQDGGYDGRSPTVFPVCIESGGESQLRKFIAQGRKMGFLIDGHSDYTDSYTCSKDFSPEIVCKSPEGKLEVNGAWAGGISYNLCLRYAWDKYIPEELEKMSGLGFDGGLFIDVFGAASPYRCCDEKHPVNRAEQGVFQKKIAEKSRALSGAVGAECGMDGYIESLDFVNYNHCRDSHIMRVRGDKPSKEGELPVVVVPFWELVYHDVVISTPWRMKNGSNMYAMTSAFLSDRDKLKLVEFGGRPLFYRTEETDIGAIKDAYDFFKTYRHLMTEEMMSHTQIGDGVYKTSYADGTDVISNYSDADFKFKGKTIKPMKYLLVK